jgi:hypothetical protein
MMTQQSGDNQESSTHAPQPVWLFSATTDLLTFSGSALAALLLVMTGHRAGWLDSDEPEWLWVAAILMIDVAHVYATAFRVYLDPPELQRRPWLYWLTPALAFLLGWAVHSESSIWFWRILAYLAVFHFVRQQYGWVALYRARNGEQDRWGWWIDSVTIYAATVYPLLYWHGNLPRQFHWFLEDDFLSLPLVVASVARPLYWVVMVIYFGRSAWRAAVTGFSNPGKDLVVLTTAVCWYVGIITYNSVFAFTVTNVIIHGVPYMVLVYRFRCSSVPQAERPRSRTRLLLAFLGTVWLLAYIEEMLWDLCLWHDRPWLFGSWWNLDAASGFLIPLLAVPQLTHYILDGFIWRRRSNARVSSLVTRRPALD